MSTLKAIDANRINSQKSTGPRSQDGKAVVSQNAAKHGLFSKHILLENESLEDFKAFKEALILDIQPATQLESLLVDRIIIQSWKLRRITKIESDILDEQNRHNLAAQRTFQTVQNSLGLLSRYDASIEKSLHKNLHELQRIQAVRAGVAVPLPVALDVTGDFFSIEP